LSLEPMVLILELSTPSKKNLYRMGNGRFFKDKRTTDWEKAATIHVLMQLEGFLGPIPKTSRLALRFTYGDKRRRDTINQAESVLDLLVKCKVIADDNWQVIPSLELSGAYEKGVDRCVVEIWPA
jgi:Holliday junction resolvase RusA-like endonuclease